MSRFMDLTGQVFGRLTAIKRVDVGVSKDGRKVTKWFCSCSCGSTTEVCTSSLRQSETKSCGCLQKEVVSAMSRKLGMSTTRAYTIWANMKSRCANKNDPAYPNYGGRGIIYDITWGSFEGFWEDMKEGYEDTLTLERVDVNGNYTKSNCTWISKGMQSRNQRSRKDNKTGKVGVSYKEDPCGIRYVCQWSKLCGKRGSKSFYLHHYEEGEAFRLACEYREEQIRILNEQGAGYSDNHGL